MAKISSFDLPSGTIVETEALSALYFDQVILVYARKKILEDESSRRMHFSTCIEPSSAFGFA